MKAFMAIVIVFLLGVIGYLSWTLSAKQMSAPVQSTAIVEQKPTNVASPPGDTMGPAPLHTKLHVSFPKPRAEVAKKFTVTGTAPGAWFFEASAPVMVLAEDGSKIASGIAQAQGDWMTIALVPFTADIVVNPAYAGPATLVLLKDNPSGLPENDDSLEIPIIVK